MDEHELKELQQQVLAMCQRHPEDIDSVLSILLRIISDLISEKGTRMRLESSLESTLQIVKAHHRLLNGDDTDPKDEGGMKHQLNQMLRQMQSNRKLHWLVVTSIVPLLAKAAWDLLLKH